MMRWCRWALSLTDRRHYDRWTSDSYQSHQPAATSACVSHRVSSITHYRCWCRSWGGRLVYLNCCPARDFRLALSVMNHEVEALPEHPLNQQLTRRCERLSKSWSRLKNRNLVWHCHCLRRRSLVPFCHCVNCFDFWSAVMMTERHPHHRYCFLLYLDCY